MSNHEHDKKHPTHKEPHPPLAKLPKPEFDNADDSPGGDSGEPPPVNEPILPRR